MKIGITGGKGGTGKSTIATALAHELSKRAKVLLVDADVDCPDDHLILSIERNKVQDVKQIIPEFDLSKCIKCGKCGEVCRFSAVAAVKDRYPIFIECPCNGCGACIISCPAKAIKRSFKKVGEIFEGNKKGLKLISAQIVPNYAMSVFVVEKQLDYVKKIEKDYDYVFVDTAAGTHCNVIEALRHCDEVISVTEPTPLGAHDLKLILELLKILGKKSKVIINRSDIGEKNLLLKIIKEHGTDIFSEIPYCKSFIESYSKGKPIEGERISKIVKSLTT